MSKLTGSATRTPIQPALEEESAADTRAQSQHDHVLQPAGGSGGRFPQNRRVGIVLEDHRYPQRLLEYPGKGYLFEREVGGREDGPVLVIYGPGASQADRLWLELGEILQELCGAYSPDR